MRTIKIVEHVSLDGVVQHSADDTDFPYDDWTTPYRTADGGEAVMTAHGERFDVLLGRRTYDLWAGLWPAAPSSPMADRINAATKYVVTHRPEDLEWGPVEAVGTDLVEGVRRIKSADGPDLVVSGSSTLIAPLLENDLADEVLLIVYPVLLGTGKRFFAEGTSARSLEPADTTTTSTGVILASYRAVRPLASGQLA